MRQFNSRESNCCRPKGLESQHRCAPLFDSPMVLLNHVVEISPRTHFHLPPAGIFLTKRLQTSKSRFIAIDVDFLRPLGLVHRRRLLGKMPARTPYCDHCRAETQWICRSYPRLEIGNADRHGQTQLFRPYATTHQEVWKSEPIDTRTLAHSATPSA